MPCAIDAHSTLSTGPAQGAIMAKHNLYTTHPYEKDSLALKLADLLAYVPEEETSLLLATAINILLSRESHRLDGREDLYGFERRLIKEAKKYIAEGKPLDAYMFCLTEHNHGHSGFVDQARRVYIRPQNAAEQKLSSSIREMIIAVVNALLKESLSEETGEFCTPYMIIISLYDCLCLLGANVPEEMIAAFKQKIAEYKKIERKNSELQTLEHSLRKRFG